MIGGPQGSGINVAAELFARHAARSGLRVFSNVEYHSNIMGEHSYYRVRLSNRDRHSVRDSVNVLVALDVETLCGDPGQGFTGWSGHQHELVHGGVAIYDSANKLTASDPARDDIILIGVPY